MPKGARKVFCTVSKWLEQEDPALYEAIDDLCALHYLKPRSDAGITFLYPDDKKYRDDIIKSAMGDSEEQLKGERMVKSLILYIHLSDAGAFVQYGSDIPNALGHKVKVAKTSGASVELADGVSITPDKDFESRGDRKNMAVWRISKGHMALEGEQATFEHAKRGKKVKGGKARQAFANRVDFASKVEASFQHYASKGKLAECDPYAESLLSLFCWLKHSDKTPLLRALLGCTGACWRTSFYIVFQPYKTSDHLVDDSTFVQWQSETMGFCFANHPAASLLDFYKNLDAKDEKDMLSSATNRKTYQGLQDAERKRLFQFAGKSTLGSALTELYKSVSSSNSLGDSQNLYPQVLAEYYQRHTDMKAYQEEVRFIIGNAFSDMESGLPVEEYVSAHKEICKVLKHRLNFDGGVQRLSLFNTDLQPSSVFWYSGPYALLRSTHFLFAGSAESDESRKVLGPDDIPEPDEANTKVDTVGSDWALTRGRAEAMKSGQTGDVFAAAKNAIAMFNACLA